jgi:type I restriction enzyme, R subunit
MSESHRPTPDSKTNEFRTRTSLIDPALKRAGWNVKDATQVGLEIPVDGYDKEPWNGISDYSLYDASGSVLAVVEAKRFSRNPRDADAQLNHYVTEIAKRQSFKPFGFMTNGNQTYFWAVGESNPRQVSAFFTFSDLDRLRFIRNNRQPLAAAPINTTIVERLYQHEAIRHVAEAFTSGKRRALIVMATGTGKTRTTMALIDLFLRTKQAQNILFLADRDALVDQALTDGFKAHLPNEPRDRIYTQRIDTSKRLFVATLQTMNICFEKFSPGFFDLIIFDEAHRSIFNRFSEVIEYFDARMIGLTATPADFIDGDTFRVFDCPDKAPTALYTYAEAVKEKTSLTLACIKHKPVFSVRK